MQSWIKNTYVITSDNPEAIQTELFTYLHKNNIGLVSSNIVIQGRRHKRKFKAPNNKWFTWGNLIDVAHGFDQLDRFNSHGIPLGIDYEYTTFGGFKDNHDGTFSSIWLNNDDEIRTDE